MRLTSFILFLISAPCLAESFYYSSHPITIDLRADQPSLLKFDSMPLSSSCHPGILKFETIDSKAITINERQHVEETMSSAKDGESTISHMLRVNPQSRSGLTTCSFFLSGGEEVPIRFKLVPELARPFIEFIPLSAKYKSFKVSSEISLLQSLVKGDSSYLTDITGDYTSCSNFSAERGNKCQKKRFSTSIAEYSLDSVGTDLAVTAWGLEVYMKEKTTFARVADLSAKHGSNILYSAIYPQKPFYEKGETIKHYIISTAKLSPVDIEEVLP